MSKVTNTEVLTNAGKLAYKIKELLGKENPDRIPKINKEVERVTGKDQFQLSKYRNAILIDTPTGLKPKPKVPIEVLSAYAKLLYVSIEELKNE